MDQPSGLNILHPQPSLHWVPQWITLFHHRLLAHQHSPWTIPSCSRVQLSPSPTQGMNPCDSFANSQLICPCLNIYYLQEWKLDLSLIGFCSLWIPNYFLVYQGAKLQKEQFFSFHKNSFLQLAHKIQAFLSFLQSVKIKTLLLCYYTFRLKFRIICTVAHDSLLQKQEFIF